MGVGHCPAPSPDALTVTVADDVPSEIVTLPPAKAGDGSARRIERKDPFIAAVMLLLLGTAV